MLMRVSSCKRGRWAIVCGVWAWCLLLLGCASHGPFVWVQDLPATAAQTPVYVIAPGDGLDVRVYNEATISGKVRVRADGKITVQFLGDVQAAGKVPTQLAAELQTQLAQFLQKPSVTIQVDDMHAMNFTIIGEVAKPGVFPLPTNTGVMQALALAGGLTQFADEDQIYVLRSNPVQRIRFSYKQLVQNEPHAAAFKLSDGDVILIE